MEKNRLTAVVYGCCVKGKHHASTDHIKTWQLANLIVPPLCCLDVSSNALRHVRMVYQWGDNTNSFS